MADPLAAVSTRRTPQTEPARPEQVPNSAGGYTFAVSDQDRLRRFLVLGTGGGTYYTSEAELTRENAAVVIDFAATDPRRLVDVAVEISRAGRAPKNNPAIFALAAASRLAARPEDRAYANAHLADVCRTGTHLFTFAGYAENLGGWGPSLRKAVAAWYTGPAVDKVALQAVKYRQRAGWTHRDLLRLAHPKLPIEETARRSLFHWITHGTDGGLDLPAPAILQDFLDAQEAATAAEAVRIIDRGNGVTWELLPTRLLNEPDVWRALIEQGMPMTALVRQLGRLTAIGVLDIRAARDRILADLSDAEKIRRSRMHPVNILVAAKTYASGHGDRGHLTWGPDRRVIDALDAAFYTAFGNVTPAGKRTLLALDVSGSMTQPAGGLPISCIEAEAAIALVTLATETDVDVVAFASGGWVPLPKDTGLSRFTLRVGYGSGITELAISPRQRLDDVLRAMRRLGFGGTDCSLPFRWAQAKGRVYDTVITMTDNETWAGDMHPHQALDEYRRATGVRTRSVVAAFASNGFSIADPDDPDSLDVVGLDSAVPNLIADFSRGL